MSIEGIKAAFASPVASPTQKAVMVVLGNYANQDHECWPSIATIMGCTAFSERTVRSALRSLEASGLIVRRDRTNARGQTTSSSYFLAFVAQAEAGTVVPMARPRGAAKGGAAHAPSPQEGAGDAPAPAPGGAAAAGGRGQELPGEGAGAAPNPLLNHQVQPSADAQARARDAEPVTACTAFDALFGAGGAAVAPQPARQPVRDTPQQPAPPGYKLPFNPTPRFINYPPIPPEPTGDPQRWMPRLSDPEHRWACLAPGEEIDPRSMNGARRQCRGAWILRDIAAQVADAMGWVDPRRYTDWRPLCAWLDDGIDPIEVIVPTIRRIAARRGNLEISTLAYFDKAVREAAAGGRRAG